MHAARDRYGISWILGALIAIAGASVGALVEHSLGGELAKDQIHWNVVFTAVCAVFVCYIVYRVFERVDELYLRMRLSVRYFPANDPDDSNAIVEMYNASRRFLAEAREDGSCEILAVNSFAEPFGNPGDAAVEDAHEAYFRSLERKLGKVHYERIIQYDESITAAELDQYISLAYRQHFLKVIDYRDHKSTHHVIRLDKVAPQYPTAFVIIDNRNGGAFLIWRVDEYASSGKAGAVFRPRGLFLISDPERQLIRHFRDWFTRLANDANTKPVHREDLGSSASAKFQSASA